MNGLTKTAALAAVIFLPAVGQAQDNEAHINGDTNEIVVIGRSVSTTSTTIEVERELLVDTATVLKEIPGANVNSNGPVTGIAQYRGLYGDRVAVSIDQLGVISGGPNAMDTPLFYASPMLLLMRFDQKRHRVLLLLLATLLMRVAIPAGYMPASVGSGLLFELCPEGMPVAILQVLDSHHHHHSASDSSEVSFDTEQCPVGHLLLSAAAVADGLALDAVPAIPVFYTPTSISYPRLTRTEYLSRGPPTQKQS